MIYTISRKIARHGSRKNFNCSVFLFALADWVTVLTFTSLTLCTYLFSNNQGAAILPDFNKSTIFF